VQVVQLLELLLLELSCLQNQLAVACFYLTDFLLEYQPRFVLRQYKRIKDS
jgi:hypothetical protein